MRNRASVSELGALGQAGLSTPSWLSSWLSRRLSRRLVGLTVGGAVLCGCAGEVVSKVKVTPPKPAPAVAVAGDADADGVPDAQDQCPDQKEDGKAPNPSDGCGAASEATDDDGDGVVGAADGCPGEPETKNGYQDGDGCPDEVPLAYIDGDSMVMKKPLAFAVGGGKVSGASKDVIDAMAQALKDDTGVELVEIGAFYAGGTSSPTDTMATRTRAAAVRDAIAERGIDSKRLRSKGYGRCTKAEGKGVVVVLHVVRRGGADTGVKLGCAR